MKNKILVITISLIFTLAGCGHVLEKGAYVSRTKTDIHTIESIKESRRTEQQHT